MAQTLYTKLAVSQIRILTICPGETDDPLVCELKTVNVLENDSQYEAISYTWGDESLRSSVTVNGVAHDVTASSAAALKIIRLPSEKRTVFIDYVCINQQDIPERGSQVALMSEVYRRAQRVLAILGPDGDSKVADAAFAAVELIAEEADGATIAHGYALGDFLFTDGFFRSAERPLACSPDFQSLAQLYNQGYFRRVWVIQEAILAPKCSVHWGSATLDFERLLRASAWLEHKSMVLDDNETGITNLPGFRGVMNMWLLKRVLAYQSERPLNQLLRNAPFGGCKDVRDQVFGLLGLYRQIARDASVPAALVPDYEKSPMAVLRDATRAAIEEQKKLEVMEKLPAKGGERPPGLPSWVVSWFRDHINSDARAIAYTAMACGSQLGWRNTELLPSDDPNILRLKGLLLDTIDEVLSPLDLATEESGYAMIDHMRSIEAIAAAAVVSLETVGMTVMAGEWINGALATKEQALLWTNCVEYFARSSNPPGPAQDIIPEADTDVYSFWRSFIMPSYNRCFFSTKSGLVGIGPFDMQSGDGLVVLQGGNKPFVLRREGVGWEFLGVAYVHDIMNGEAVEQYLTFEEGQQLADEEGVTRLWRGKEKPREMVFDLV